MNIVSKIGVKQDGQDFGWMRNRGDSSRLRTTTNSSGYTTSSSSASNNNYNNGLFSSSNTVDGRLKSKPWTESCVEPSFLSSPPQPPPPSSPLSKTHSGDSKFSVFGNPIQNSFSNYSDSTGSLEANQSRESFWSVSGRTDDKLTNNCDTNHSTHGQDGDQLAGSVASLSLHGKSDADRKAPLTIETRRENPPPKSWASIASQPVKTGKTTSLFKTKMAAASVLSASTRSAPIVASLEAFGSWEAKNGSSPKSSQITSPPVQTSTKHSPWSSSFSASSSTSSDPTPDQSCSSASSGRDVGFLVGPGLPAPTDGNCNSVTGNNDSHSTSASSISNNTGSSSNNNNTHSQSSSSTVAPASLNNNNCSVSNTPSCTSSSNNSSKNVAPRRDELTNHACSSESSNSPPVRASLNHRNSSSQSIAPSTANVSNTSASTRLVHPVTNGSHRDAQYEKENGYRESNNVYMNSHKRNWRESNVEVRINTESKSHNNGNNSFKNNHPNEVHSVQRRPERTCSSSSSNGGGPASASSGDRVAHLEPVVDPSAIMDKQKLDNLFNPKEFDLDAVDARFFVIKSYSEDDIHRSIKYSIWCSTNHGNKRLDAAFKSQEGKGPVYLFYSVNGSGHFCGMAQMMSGVDHDSSVNVWAQDKWKGQFKVKWIYVKDVPNSSLRHIRLENNENKQVTNSRDTQEVPHEKGKQVLKIIHSFSHSTSIFDDFLHYEKRQKEEISRKVEAPVSNYRDGRSDVLRPRKDDQQLPQQSQPSSIESHRPASSHTDTHHQVSDEDTSRAFSPHKTHREMYRDLRAGAGLHQQSYQPRSDYNNSSGNSNNNVSSSSVSHPRNSHKSSFDAPDRGHYERARDPTNAAAAAATGENSVYRDHRYSNHQSVRNYDQGAPTDQRDSYYHQHRRNKGHQYSHHSNHHHNQHQHLNHHQHQQQGENIHASHYSSNSTSISSSHHNQRTSWRD